MLKRYIPVAAWSSEFSDKQLQPQYMPIGQVVTPRSGLSPLICPSLPEGAVCNGAFSPTLLYHWIPFTRVMEVFILPAYFSTCVFGDVRNKRKKCVGRITKKHCSRHGQQNYCIVCYSIHCYVSFIIIISVPSPASFSSLAHCALLFVS
jgi:hypothetical protein